MTAKDTRPEILGSAAGLGAAVAIESGPELGENAAVEARGYWEQVWRRFRRDRVAVGSIFFLLFLVVVCFPGAWLAEQLLGHGPDDQFFNGLDERARPGRPVVVDRGSGVGQRRRCSSSARTARSAATSSSACSTAAASRCRSPSSRRSA